MNCLSKICSFCLRSNLQLKLLKETQFSTFEMESVKILIGESVFLEAGHVLSICEDCTKQIKEMNSFCQTTIKNSRILIKHVQQLHFGHVRVQLNEMYSTDPGILTCTDKLNMIKNIYTAGNNVDGDLKIKEEDEEECKQELGNEEVEEKKFKIEIHDEFEETYGCLKSESNEMQVDYLVTSIGENEEPTSVKEELQVLELIEETMETVQENSKPHKCETCGKCFVNESNLTKHSTFTHTRKPHKCETCGKCFSKKGSLANHTFTHKTEKPHRCKTCGKLFSEKSNLTEHALIHTKEKPYKCETCGKSFAHKGCLTKHILLYSYENPDGSKICGKSCTQKPLLTRYSSLHEKSHKCENCEKTFTKKNSLIRHMKTHSIENPYRCKTCGIFFSQWKDLYAHMTSHLDEKVEKPRLLRTYGKCLTSSVI